MSRDEPGPQAEGLRGTRSRAARLVAFIAILVVVAFGWWGAFRWVNRPPADGFSAADAQAGRVTFHAIRTEDGMHTAYGYTNRTSEVHSVDESQIGITDARGLAADCGWDGSDGDPWQTVAPGPPEVEAYGNCDFAGTPTLPLTLYYQGVPVARAERSAGS